MKLPKGCTLVVASHNKGKVREIFDLLAPYGITVKGAGELGLPEPEETGTTFAENAILKARAAALATKTYALADDSGLAVAALDGSPGIYSARWAGETRDFTLAMAKVARLLTELNKTDRSAKFVCSLALSDPDGKVEVFEGEVHGHLEFPPRGSNGFGYDPIFVANGMHETFGEIDPALKHSISHRANAFKKFAAAVLA
ncbi:RdgB/HAM1 family non-canonical purine NTP pyrophosphatase [Rhizomicrobium electricum]|uniref:dITP/XTP pyrophosphatase n=1 Tax=Rhizomicrobium electricum TaxID=480070 RepID=A0ABP3QC18_9PROT|nr:RdgB/HAM1 family non-canonical purine NTP pyrophosphatase [Rhizomicrobium electricum]NIJ49203.1 XTP/dITP diphosphohydrolase [Rhizomicrobium electricum]